MALLCRHHPQVVPSVGVVGAYFERLLKILPCLLEIVPAQVERAQIVVAFGVVGFGSNHLQEGVRCLVQIAVLKQRNAIGELVTVKQALGETTFEGDGTPYPFGYCRWGVARIFQYAHWIDWALIHLDDHALLIEQERRWNCRTSGAIKSI